ncbi:uncharacterized protein LOC132858221 [Tachysurus vachellii]|nr:uncharacterized protein LOC132858221 [Tachysurus vachellii]
MTFCYMSSKNVENSQRSMLLFLGMYIFLVQWILTHQQVNVALGGIATQSSTYLQRYASFAIDGNRATNVNSHSCTTTNAEYNPWWRVDLLAVYDISNVIITNRGDCCTDRLNGGEIHIGNSLINNGNNNFRCVVILSIPAGASENYTCNMRGRYVNIILPYVTQYLTLCEVEVYGVAVPVIKRAFLRVKFNSTEDLNNPTTRDNVLQKIKFDNVQKSAFQVRWTKEPELETFLLRTVNVALKGIATQSSSYSGSYYASLAIDGNRASNMNSYSCTTTNAQIGPWWKVDLLAVYDISNVIITNRADCCAERINGAEIHIGNSLINNGNNNPRCVVIPSMPAGASVNYTCNMRGRYVNIIIPSITQFLTLCEVEVYGVAVPVFKRAFLRIKFNSTEDLNNPTMRDKVLQKIKSANIQSSVFQIRWTKEPELEPDT